MDTSNRYEVEKILGHRENGGQRQYYIKWKGYSSQDNTWEPAGNLKSCKRVLKSYIQSRRLPLGSKPQNADGKIEPHVHNPWDSAGCSEKSHIRNVSSITADTDRTAQLDPSPQLSIFRNGSNDNETVSSAAASSPASREERARMRQLRAHTEGGARKRPKNAHRKPLVIPFKFHKRKVEPEILDATEVRGELHFVVKWPNVDQLELIGSAIMYVEYPLYVFKFYEKCLTWVHFDKS